MLDWLSRKPSRIYGLLIGYFLMHVLVRVAVSPSLDYDESEQVFLAQWFAFGYNSQPPLYTWVLMGLFQVLGTSVFTLALMKNGMLLLTYLLSFELVRQVTGDTKASIVASLGLITMPQIGYESHRDLSHTVAVTMVTVAMFFVVVMMEKRRTLLNYALLGVVVGIGLMCKYNFAMSIGATAISAWSVPRFRTCLLDKRLCFSVLIAAVLLSPHALWMVDHMDLVSGKTVDQLTSARTHSWFSDVLIGAKALGSTALGCGAISILIFAICFRDSVSLRKHSLEKANAIQVDVARLLERFFIVVGMCLLLMVLSGHAVAFKNRWLQPFFVLLPAYLTLRFLSLPHVDEKAAIRLCLACTALMIAFSAAIAFRPVAAGYRQKYSWLNIPYQGFVERTELTGQSSPSLVIASNMRMAGNMRVQFPNAFVLSADHPHLQSFPEGTSFRNVLLITDFQDDDSQSELRQFASSFVQASNFDFEQALVPFHLGLPGDEKEFFYHVQGRTRLATKDLRDAERH